MIITINYINDFNEICEISYEVNTDDVNKARKLVGTLFRKEYPTLRQLQKEGNND